uniref:Uncharacterized protein n=1 Tax=Chlamydomonas euryale TaxID=1486919 RepID=A0A7R9VIW9_9CHLO
MDPTSVAAAARAGVLVGAPDGDGPLDSLRTSVTHLQELSSSLVGMAEGRPMSARARGQRASGDAGVADRGNGSESAAAAAPQPPAAASRYQRVIASCAARRLAGIEEGGFSGGASPAPQQLLGRLPPMDRLDASVELSAAAAVPTFSTSMPPDPFA